MAISQVTMMAGTAMIQARAPSRRPTSAVSSEAGHGQRQQQQDQRLLGAARLVQRRSAPRSKTLTPRYSRIDAYSSTSGVRRLR